MKIFLITVLLLSSSIQLVAQENKFVPSRKYSPDSLKSWTTSTMDGISEKHPGFYRYTTKERFDFLIDSTKQSINDSLTELQYYRKLKPLFAQIGCLHTGISLSKEYQVYLDKTNTLLPLEVFIDLQNSKVLISKNYSANEHIPIGGEITSINEVSISSILKKILSSIPSDGYNQTEKNLLLNHRFSFWYQSIIDASTVFNVGIKTNGNNNIYELKGISKDKFPSFESLEKNYKKPLEFEITNGVGLLKIHTFSKSSIKEAGQNFQKVTKDVFETLKQQNVENLVVDLRYNTGGTDGNAALLASYFFDQPFRYWDKIEVTEAVAKEIKGMNRLFYNKTVEVNGSFHWRKTWFTKEFDYYETQQSASNNFKGKTYIITNGLCMSSCSDFVAILSHNNKAIIVGQETGGGYQGNTSGMMPEATIPTGLIVTIPLQKYTNAVDLTKNFGHGTIPDYEIVQTFDNWVHKKDVELDFTFDLIKRK
ncbi:S41 family peptidase [Marivirga salinae]|uniref:S41 family peptidase n=1 Tax=Marivirga salinarum TaxID=3059078 RepID=A0AA49GDX6_9BACT|nr:S41 family peptidase [Marivirga sp. BDSF4-3]WKK74718.2 S41 family peptidase [Marivirga sp. BDSF4-3]